MERPRHHNYNPTNSDYVLGQMGGLDELILDEVNVNTTDVEVGTGAGGGGVSNCCVSGISMFSIIICPSFSISMSGSNRCNP